MSNISDKIQELKENVEDMELTIKQLEEDNEKLSAKIAEYEAWIWEIVKDVEIVRRRPWHLPPRKTDILRMKMGIVTKQLGRVDSDSESA